MKTVTLFYVLNVNAQEFKLSVTMATTTSRLIECERVTQTAGAYKSGVLSSLHECRVQSLCLIARLILLSNFRFSYRKSVVQCFVLLEICLLLLHMTLQSSAEPTTPARRWQMAVVSKSELQRDEEGAGRPIRQL